MDIWRGKWEFKNSRSLHDGKTDLLTVSANSEEEARDQIKSRVSRKLCGISTMQAFVVVTDLVNVSKKIS